MLFAMIGFGEREGKVRVNFEESKFVYDIRAHDWTVEETAATIRFRAFEEMLKDYVTVNAEIKDRSEMRRKLISNLSGEVL